MNQKSIIRENSKKFRQRKCSQHQLFHFQKVCTHSTCIQSIESSLLCNQCFRKHPGNHNGLIQYYLEFDKIFSENVFTEIESFENECLNLLLENKQRVDAEVDRQCDVFLEEIKKLLESIKSRTKLKYGSNDLIDTITMLKESLKIEYNALFSIDEADIKNEDIKQYLKFYLNYEKTFEQNQAKTEEIYKDMEKELSNISQLFNQKVKDIKLIFESDKTK